MKAFRSFLVVMALFTAVSVVGAGTAGAGKPEKPRDCRGAGTIVNTGAFPNITSTISSRDICTHVGVVNNVAVQLSAFDFPPVFCTPDGGGVGIHVTRTLDRIVSAPDGSTVTFDTTVTSVCQSTTPPTGQVTNSGTNVSHGVGTGRFEGPVCRVDSFTQTLDFDTNPISFVTTNHSVSC